MTFENVIVFFSKVGVYERRFRNVEVGNIERLIRFEVFARHLKIMDKKDFIRGSIVKRKHLKRRRL